MNNFKTTLLLLTAFLIFNSSYGQLTSSEVNLLDEEGIAQSIKMKGISPNIDFSFDFQDLDLKRIE